MEGQHRNFTKIIILVFCAFLLLAYIFVLHPIISWALGGPIITRGVDLYIEHKYLKYEQGELFQKTLNTLGFADTCTVVDFKYYNNCMKDNIIYGKFPDVFCLELQAEGNYGEIINYVEGISQRSTLEGNYDIHLLDELSSKDVFFCVAVNNTTKRIRCLMVTDRNYPIYDNLGRIFYNLTDLKWD